MGREASAAPIEIIGPYSVEARIGTGGMGEVYRAVDPRLGRCVALKRIRYDARQRATARRRFLREARVAARLSHPSIVKVHDLLAIGDDHWIVMEWVPGKTLSDRLLRGPLSPPAALDIAIDLLQALDVMHAEGVIHRDLKASNVLLTTRERAKLLDFGLAKAIASERERPASRDASASITLDGQIVGTPHAMSPEQALGRTIDARPDLFALGTLLYEMLTGVAPFRGADMAQTLAMVCHQQPTPVADLVPALPTGLSDLVDNLLEKDMVLRPAGATEVALQAHRLRPRRRQEVELPRYHTITEPGPSATLAPSPVANERRRVTVLSGRIVARDATEIPELTPEASVPVATELERLSRMVIGHLEGHVASFLGHGLVAYFGYPVLHEDDALRATKAALELADQIARSSLLEQAGLLLRAGIHTGPAVILGKGSARDADPLILGQTLDRAHDLQRHAGAATVLVSAATHRLVASAYRLEPLNPESHRAFRLLGPRPLGPSWCGQTRLPPIIGREQDMALLLRCWAQASGGQGRVVLLSGDAGIGKSRMIHAFAQHLSNRSMMLVGSHCSPHEQGSPLAPIVDLVRRLLGLTSSDDPVSELELRLAERGLDSAESLALFADLLALPLPSDHPGLRLSPRRRRERTMQLIEALTMSVARAQPTVLIIEDLHWVDPSTLEFLAALIANCAGVPILLLLSFRPELEVPWQPAAHISQLHLRRFARKEVDALITRVAGGKTLPDAVNDQINAKTDGVPLFVEELTKTLLDSDLLQEEQARWTLVGSLEKLTIPDTLRGSLAARLERLGPAKEIAQIAATIGREFHDELLLAVSGVDADSLTAHLDRLIDVGLVLRKGFSARHRRFAFKHALIRDAAYESQLHREREEIHRRIAVCYEERFSRCADEMPERLGHHWEMAHRPDKALPYLTRAADFSKTAYANDEAVAFYQQALRLARGPGHPATEGDSSMIRLHENLGDLLALSRRFGESRSSTRAAIALAHDPLLHARLHRKLGRTFDLENDEAMALDELSSAEIVLGTTPPEPSRAHWREWIEIQLAKGISLYKQGKMEELEKVHQDLDQRVRRHGSPAHRTATLRLQLTICLRRERYQISDQIVDLAHRYLEASEEEADERRCPEARCNLGFVYLFRRDYDRSLEALTQALGQARKVGDTSKEHQCLAYLSLAHRRSGNLEEARRTSKSLLRDKPRLEYQGLAKGNLAWVALQRADLESVDELGRAAFDLWRQVSMSFPFQWIALFPLLRVSLHQNRSREIGRWLRQLLNSTQERFPADLAHDLQHALDLHTPQQMKPILTATENATRTAKAYDYL